MATITDFRELRCWQKARVIAKQVYAITRQGDFAKDFGLRDQVQRAAVSIGANIAEGFERDSNQELAKFLSYAKGSAGEIISQLYTAFDIGYISNETLVSMVEQLKRVSALIARFQATIRRSPIKGLYYKNSNPPTSN